MSVFLWNNSLTNINPKIIETLQILFKMSTFSIYCACLYVLKELTGRERRPRTDTAWWPNHGGRRTTSPRPDWCLLKLPKYWQNSEYSLTLSFSLFLSLSVRPYLSLSLSKEREREVERERRDREDYNFTVNISHCNIRYKIHVIDKKMLFRWYNILSVLFIENLFVNSCFNN